MATRKNTHTPPAARKLAELSVAAPQVIAHRMTRMALNGPIYPRRDQVEFTRMVQEKQVAFMQSWAAMFTESMKLQQQYWQFWLRASTQAWGPGLARRASRRQAVALQRIADKGLAPVHAKAKANARRLARTRLR